MTPQELKNSILQLAIQGKLVEQRPEEGTAAELLEKIFAAKGGTRSRASALMTGGTGATSGTGARPSRPARRAASPASPAGPTPVSPEDAPFEIPESWVWVRLGDIFDLINGKAFKPSDWSNSGIPIVRIQNLNDANASYHYFAGNIEVKFLLHGGELLFSWSGTPGTSFGAFIWRGGKAVLNQHIFIMSPRIKLNYEYSKQALNGELPIFISKAHGGAGLQHITRSEFERCYFPLPPLAEQKRIVAKIEELLPLIDRYEKAWSRLEDFNKRFPVDMQKSLLQLAIQGKLVEQRPEEGTAAELLEKIFAAKNAKDAKKNLTQRRRDAEATKESRLASSVSRPVEDAPFDIPESWEWVRLGELLLSQPSNGVSPHGVAYQTPYKNLTLTATTSGYFRPEAFKYVEVSSELAEKYYLHDEDILIQRANSRELVGTSCIYRHGNQKFIYPDLMMRLHLLDGISVDFVHFVLKSPPCRAYFQATASGTSESMPKINQSIVRNTLIPLPPLAEQKRIVAKLEEILPLCERLK